MISFRFCFLGAPFSRREVNPRKVNPVNPEKFSEACHLISSEVAKRRLYVLGNREGGSSVEHKKSPGEWTRQRRFVVIIGKIDFLDVSLWYSFKYPEEKQDEEE